MRIEIDELSRPQVHALLQEHLDNMHELSPPEQVFALDLSKLRAPDITFWTVWQDDDLIGCGALKELSPRHGEKPLSQIRIQGVGSVRELPPKPTQHVHGTAAQQLCRLASGHR